MNLPAIMGYFDAIYTSPINSILLLLIAIVSYRLLCKAFKTPPKVDLPPMIQRDFTLSELRIYDGTCAKDPGRILVGLNHVVYDVSSRPDLYSSNGYYCMFGGRDISRAHATLQINEDNLRQSYDNLSDLSTEEQENLTIWQSQFDDRYPKIGMLVKDKPDLRAEYSSDESTAD
ncbi:hypothetical protein GJ496_001973 [Pomphorhynchus laevis]|nr:hypothetical protein GJ496_001973 [Pomphorhynchus laevis]